MLMKTLPLYVLLLIATIGLSCKKNCCIMIDANITINLVSKSSENLLAPPNGLTLADIDVYYMKDGVKTLYFERHLDASKGFLINKHSDGQEKLTLFPTLNKDKFTETMVKFGDLGTDTIRCEYYKTDNQDIVKKVWLNGKLAWDGKGIRELTIVK